MTTQHFLGAARRFKQELFIAIILTGPEILVSSALWLMSKK